MNFSEKLKQYRKDNNLTQEALAEKLRISRQAVSKWEQGRGYPDIKTIEDLSLLMGISIDELISNKETKTLTVDSANKINKTVKKYFITICSISLALVVALSVIIGILAFKPQEELKGLVGFYIDVLQDGEINLYQPNGVDIYFYKLAGVEGRYAKNGILNEKTTSIHYMDGTSYFFAESEIIFDINIKGDFVLYDIMEDKNGQLTATKRQELKHSDLISAVSNMPTSSIYFTNNDYMNKDGKDIGRTFNFYFTYKALPTKIKVVQYSDIEFKDVIDEHTILSSTEMPDVSNPQPFANMSDTQAYDFTVRILDTTQSYKIFETIIVNGVEVEHLVFSQNFMVSMTATKKILFANEHSYVSKIMNLVITNQS